MRYELSAYTSKKVLTDCVVNIVLVRQDKQEMPSTLGTRVRYISVGE